MTLALCLHCGAGRFGAFGECPECGEATSGDPMLDLQFSSQYLSAATLEGFGEAIREIHRHDDDEKTCFWSFVRWMSLHHPEVLFYKFGEAESEPLDALLSECTLPTVEVEPWGLGVMNGSESSTVEDDESIAAVDHTVCGQGGVVSESWALVTNAKNFAVCHARGLWGDTEEWRIRQLAEGDLVALYVRANQGKEKYSLPGGGAPEGRQIGGVARVAGAVRETSEQVWPDRMYRFVVDLEWLSPYPPAAYVDTRKDGSRCVDGTEVCANQGDFMLRVPTEQVRSWRHRLKKASEQW